MEQARRPLVRTGIARVRRARPRTINALIKQPRPGAATSHSQPVGEDGKL